MTIFAVDDERFALDLVEDVVAETVPECTFRRFSEPEDFLDAMAESPADVALMDVEIPGITGVELAKKAQELAPKLNVVFLTGYSRYKGDAMDIFASGYILKPITEEKLRAALSHLRYTPREKQRLTVQTEPYFAVLLDGQPLPFQRHKTQELLAYLVYRRGQRADALEIRRALFGRSEGMDPKTNSYFHHLKKDLQDTAEKCGLEKIIVFSDGGYALEIPDLPDTEKVRIALRRDYDWVK